jgi:hypothetical protein
MAETTEDKVPAPKGKKPPSMDAFLATQKGVTPTLEALFKSRARHAKPEQYDEILKGLWR